MKAVQITTLDGPSAVEFVDLADPEAGDGQVLVRVRAAGVSFPEVLQTRGLYQMKPPLPFTPGAEVAGDVVTAPEGSHFSPGDRVVAFVLVGGFAELAVAGEDMVFPLPDNVPYEQGAALPLNYLTAYFALIERGRMSEGESILVHGGAGGVGTAAIQVAKAYGAGRVIAVTSTAEKGAVALEAGADEFTLVEGFKDAAEAVGGVDIVVDPVGGDRFTDSLRSLKAQGRLLVIGFTDGEIPTVSVNQLMLNTEVVGVYWGGHNLKHPGHTNAQWEAILPHIRSGSLNPVVGASFPLEQAGEALALIDSRRATGKIVLHSGTD